MSGTFQGWSTGTHFYGQVINTECAKNRVIIMPRTSYGGARSDTRHKIAIAVQLSKLKNIPLHSYVMCKSIRPGQEWFVEVTHYNCVLENGQLKDGLAL